MNPFSPAKLGPLTLRNRFIKAATFEGMAENGLVTERLVDFHREVAAGGVALTTLAYLAVSADGQGAPAEIVVRREALPGLRRLADAVHAEGALVSAQIGHAGPVAAAGGMGKGLAPSRIFIPRAMRFTTPVTTAELSRITADFARSARMLQDAGFDAVEIHMGHNYLLSAFLSPALNHRKDRFGGSLENRAEFPRQVAAAVREAVGPSMAVLAKFNMVDGYSGGLWLSESLQVASMLQRDGGLDALELTSGSSLRNPMYLFRGDSPLEEMAQRQRQPMRSIYRIAGKRVMRDYLFQEAYFQPHAREFRARLSMPLVLLGGISSLATVRGALDGGFDFLALGRALLREPRLINRWQAGESADALCVRCNRCVPTIYEGTRCVLRDDNPDRLPVV